MNLLTLDKLAQKDRKAARRVLIEVQNVLLCVGKNYALDDAANIMNFAYHVKYVWGGKISEDPRDLLKVYGVGRKVLMLIFQDAWAVHPHKGIVCDSHVTAAFFNLGLTTMPMPDGELSAVADKVAEEAEKWVPRELHRDVNECLASPRQLWANSYNYQWMRTGAKKVDCYKMLRVICAGVSRKKVSTRNEPLRSPIMEARRESFFKNKFFGRLPPKCDDDKEILKVENNMVI